MIKRLEWETPMVVVYRESIVSDFCVLLYAPCN